MLEFGIEQMHADINHTPIMAGNANTMYWTGKIFRPYIAIVCLWLVTNTFLFFNDYSIITERYRIETPELMTAITMATSIDETGRKQGQSLAREVQKKNKLFDNICKNSFIDNISDNIRLDAIKSVNEFVGDIRLSDIPDNLDGESRILIPEEETGSVSEYKNSYPYQTLSSVDKLRALELFYRTRVLPDITWESEQKLSGVFAEMAKDVTYHDAKKLFYANEVIPELRKEPALRKFADVVFGLDHSMNLYEAYLNRYALIRFDNNNAMFIPYNSDPSASAEKVSNYINGLKTDEILEKLRFWGLYAFLPPVSLFFLGSVLLWVKHRGKQDLTL